MANPAHVRIDEGVKRGPRKMPQRMGIKRRDAAGRAVAVIPADLLPATVIDRYLADERTADIAASYGIARSRLNQWLLEHAEEHWRKAQVSRAVTALDQAKDDLEGAQDPLSLARAREQLRGAQWELERLYSRLFGVKQEVTHNVAVSVEHRLESSASQLLEAFVSEPQQNALQHDPVDNQDNAEDVQVIET